MKQYEFQIVRKWDGRVEFARATAKSPEIARAQIVLMYGLQFDVMGLFRDVNPPHHVLGEINCEDFPDCPLHTKWLFDEAAKIEFAEAN
jgi:hypothetical protein